jgi:hypothetical protein
MPPESNAPANATSEASNNESQELDSSVENNSTEGSNPTQVVSELQDKLETDPSLSKEEKKEIKKQIKQLKLKVDGKEITEDLPFEIPDDPAIKEYMTKQLQMAKMGGKRAQEFSKLQGEVKTFFERLRSNPEEVLSDPDVGVDVKQLAAKIIEKEIENSKKSPEQIEKEKLESELKKMKEEREKEKKDLQEKEFQRLQEQEYQRYDTLMSKALEKSDLPKSPYIIKKMADYMLLGVQQGMDVSPEDVLPLVREEMQNDLKEMFAVMPDEVIEALVGKDVITRLRKKSVSKVKQNQIPNKKVQDTGVVQKAEEKKEKVSFKEFFKL